LGSHLARALLAAGAKVIGVDIVPRRDNSVLNVARKNLVSVQGDVSFFNIVRYIIGIKKPAIIFHLAAEAIVEKAYNNPVRTFKSNIEGTWNILEVCRGKKYVEGIVVASSDKAYGSQSHLPYKEDSPLQGLHPYDASKSCEDIIAQTYYHSYGLPVTVVRCGNIFGPGDLNFSRLIPDAIRCAVQSKRFVIRSDGKFTRDYVYIDDIVNGYILLAENMKKKKLYGEAFNLSNEKPLSVLKAVRKIKEVYGAGEMKAPKVVNRVKYEIRDQYLSAKKAKKILGWKPAYTFEEGLKKTIMWYKNMLSRT